MEVDKNQLYTGSLLQKNNSDTNFFEGITEEIMELMQANNIGYGWRVHLHIWRMIRPGRTEVENNFARAMIHYPNLNDTLKTYPGNFYDAGTLHSLISGEYGEKTIMFRTLAPYFFDVFTKEYNLHSNDALTTIFKHAEHFLGFDIDRVIHKNSKRESFYLDKDHEHISHTLARKIVLEMIEEMKRIGELKL